CIGLGSQRGGGRLNAVVDIDGAASVSNPNCTCALDDNVLAHAHGTFHGVGLITRDAAVATQNGGIVTSAVVTNDHCSSYCAGRNSHVVANSDRPSAPYFGSCADADGACCSFTVGSDGGAITECAGSTGKGILAHGHAVVEGSGVVAHRGAFGIHGVGVVANLDLRHRRAREQAGE